MKRGHPYLVRDHRSPKGYHSPSRRRRSPATETVVGFSTLGAGVVAWALAVGSQMAPILTSPSRATAYLLVGLGSSLLVLDFVLFAVVNRHRELTIPGAMWARRRTYHGRHHARRHQAPQRIEAMRLALRPTM